MDRRREGAHQRRVHAEFQAKYQQGDLLGTGGYGSVFAGVRREDNVPNGISTEVAVMLKLKETFNVTSAPVQLLDWYTLDQELILVLERPVHATDLHAHINNNGGPLEEDAAKVIMKQLIDAAIDLERKKIFHRDIKPENILIETSTAIPRVRLIDFGLSCFCEKSECYRDFFGTEQPPEFNDHRYHSPGPTTVFQMGLVLYNMLHSVAFVSVSFYEDRQTIRNDLSKDCQEFFETSLCEDPKERATLKQLRIHPWLL
ncbi:serine/threonine-protein kinase pim-1-like [Lycodopsis pacificus]